MNWTEKTQVIGLTALVTAALVLGGALLLAPYLRRLAADDAPIVMLGGSFHMLSIGADHLVADHNGHSLHQSSHHTVYSIAVNLGPATPVDAAAKADVVFVYCDPNDCNGKSDTVRVRFDNSSTKVIDIVAKSNIDQSPETFPGWFSHPQGTWKLQSVDFGNLPGLPPLNCNGICSVAFNIH
jgi:hypothetical protein